MPDEEEEEEEEMEELEVAGQSILENVVEQEVGYSWCKNYQRKKTNCLFFFQITIGEIEHFENEEEVVDVDWLK